jgi:hypothetical protein
MPTEAERRPAVSEALKADQETIRQAAYLLRQRAVQEAYAGWRHKEVALAVAHLFDTLELAIRNLEPAVRQELVSVCRELSRTFQPEHDVYLAQRPDAPKTVTHKQLLVTGSDHPRRPPESRISHQLRRICGYRQRFARNFFAASCRPADYQRSR